MSGWIAGLGYGVATVMVVFIAGAYVRMFADRPTVHQTDRATL